jgi:nucleoid-associated protein YgaU
MDMWEFSVRGTRWGRVPVAVACAALFVVPMIGCGSGEEPSASAPSEQLGGQPAAAAPQQDELAVETDIVEVEEVAVVAEPVVVEPAAETPELPDVAAAPPAPVAPQARTHTVQRGETLRVIAEHYYGNRNRADEIYQANRSTLSDPNRIRPGQVLAIP